MDPSQYPVPDQAAGNVDDSFSNELRCWSGNSNGHAVESEQMENEAVDEMSDLENENAANLFLELYKATLRGDWGTLEAYFKSDPSSLDASISDLKETVLHVAVSTGHSADLIRHLVEYMPASYMERRNKNGSTPLHYAAIAGNTPAAELLVRKNPGTPLLRNNYGYKPLQYAARFGHRQTIYFLLSTTPDKDPNLFDHEFWVEILNLLIAADFYDIALDLLHRYPGLALQGARHPEDTTLLALAKKPHAFTSGSQIGRFKRILYKCCWSHNFVGDVSKGGRGILLRAQDKKSMHLQATELLRFLISEALKASPQTTRKLLKRPLQEAAKLGILEIVKEIIKAYPESIWFVDEDKRDLFHLAIIHRQENIYNLLYQMSSRRHFLTISLDKRGNNMLHLAGKLALSESDKTSGPALQMQSEMQWFKEVEKVVQPLHRDMLNDDGDTPKMVFERDHRELISKGEIWMKETAGSCSTVTALVVTVVFAAAFTVPGGNNQDIGIPIFLKKPSFMIFAISDALAFFSSSTSLLMFLSLFNSRFSTQKDFFRCLTQLSIGLVTLFFSIVSMVVAFSASFYMLLFHQVEWIAFPICILASVPVTLFAYFQFPLWYDIASSTFGRSKFGKKGKEIIF